jgi:hypothetical protein
MEIVGFENYLIYEDGKVQNKKTKRYLQERLDNNGYKKVNLCKDGKGKTFRIHRLVALHYIPNPENKPQVDHINRDKTDNRIQNLRWVSPSENCQNTGIPITNTSGHKNIYYYKPRHCYCYQKIFRGVNIQKYFKTLEEAVEYKREYEKTIQ